MNFADPEARPRNQRSTITQRAPLCLQQDRAHFLDLPVGIVRPIRLQQMAAVAELEAGLIS
jgi:hypothetical protein